TASKLPKRRNGGTKHRRNTRRSIANASTKPLLRKRQAASFQRGSKGTQSDPPGSSKARTEPSTGRNASRNFIRRPSSGATLTRMESAEPGDRIGYSSSVSKKP